MSRVIHFWNSLNPFAFYRALSVLLCLSLAYAVSLLIPNQGASIWLWVSASLFSVVAFTKSSQRLIHSGVAGLCLAGLALLFSVLQAPWMVIVVLLGLTISASIFGRRCPSLYLTALIVNVLGLALVFAPVTQDQAIARAGFLLLGALIAAVVKMMMGLYQYSRRATNARILFFQRLQTIFQIILTFERRNDLAEQKFQNAWSSYLAAQQLMRNYTTQKQMLVLEKLGSIAFSLGSLPLRLKDQAVYTIVQREFADLLKAITDILSRLQKAKTVDMKVLSASIGSLESLYESTLQTITEDALPFVLFIQDLYALEKTLSEVSVAELVLNDESPRVKSEPKPAVVIPVLRVTIAVLAALVITYFLKPPHTGWLSLTALLLTQTSIALPLHQIIKRGLVLMTLLALASYVSPLLMLTALPVIAYQYANLEARAGLSFILFIFISVVLVALIPLVELMPTILDVLWGVLIAAACHLLLFPDKADREFAKRIVPLLKADQDYYAALMNNLLNTEDAAAIRDSKLALEKLWANRDIHFPLWVFDRGFSPALKVGQYYFVVQLGQITEILFALQPMAQYSFTPDFIAKFKPTLEAVSIHNQQLFTHVIALFEEKPIKPPSLDGDIVILEETFRAHVDVTLELLDISKDYVTLAALVRNLKDLRALLLKLTATLRLAENRTTC